MALSLGKRRATAGAGVILWGLTYHLVMTKSSPWKITMLLVGKPSISMGHLYHGELLNNQRVNEFGLLGFEIHYIDGWFDGWMDGGWGLTKTHGCFL